MNSSDQKNYLTFFFVAVASKMEKNNLVDFSSLPILFFTSTCSTLLFYLTLQSAASLTHSYKLSLRAEQLQHTLSSCNPLSLALSITLPPSRTLSCTHFWSASWKAGAWHPAPNTYSCVWCGVLFLPPQSSSSCLSFFQWVSQQEAELKLKKNFLCSKHHSKIITPKQWQRRRFEKNQMQKMRPLFLVHF